MGLVHTDRVMIIKVCGRWILSVAPDASDKVASLWRSAAEDCASGRDSLSPSETKRKIRRQSSDPCIAAAIMTFDSSAGKPARSSRYSCLSRLWASGMG